MKRIASIGDNCMDIYVNATRRVYVGGNGVNLAVAVRRSGVGCSYVGMAGDDGNGRRVARFLAEEGVDVSHLRIVPGETGWAKIMLDGDEWVPMGDELGVQRQFELGEDDYGFVGGHDFAHYTAFTNWLSSYEGGFRDYEKMVGMQLERLAAARVRLSIDYSDREAPGILELSRDKVEVAFFSRSGMEDGEISREASRLLDYGFRLVVLTRGARGSCAYDGDSCIFQEIAPTTLVDPLGAGDAFMGAFLSRYVYGEPVKNCLGYAAEYSAQVCGRYGGQ